MTIEQFNDVKKDFLLHIKMVTGISTKKMLVPELKNWYVGVSKNPDERKKQHESKKKYLVHHFAYANLQTLDNALNLEESLHQEGLAKLSAEMDNNTANEGLKGLSKESKFVYVFKFR